MFRPVAPATSVLLALLASLVPILHSSAFAASLPRPPAPALSAAAAFVIDAGTGEVLLEHAADGPRPMASTTKIMTAVVTLDTVPPHRLDEVFTVGTMRPRPGETVMGPRTGEKVTVRELLYGLLLSSGNDAADALAVRVAGPQQRFVQLMNTKRDLLGLRHTNFANPSGLDHPNHYTTARDLATLALHALQYPEFARIVAQRTYQVGGGAGGRELVNLNVPLFYYPGVTG